ncbi:MAG: P-II family nitrogen regulator, partial [Bacteroidaceae bacterium]|nr:P-II family nitrogen regulator [Bacteroidaceae bacterium]
MENKMIYALVGRNSGELLVNAAKGAGARGGTIIPCRSISDNAVLQFFGLGESDQDAVIIVTEGEKLKPILDAMQNAAHEDKRLCGFAAVTGVSSVMKFMAENNRMEYYKTGEQEMDRKTSHEMIFVIVNSGFADDVMAAARKAGAHGGTVLNARGTGKQEDVKFFGITIVPEKEILLIIAEKEKSAAIMDAVKALDCFA